MINITATVTRAGEIAEVKVLPVTQVAFERAHGKSLVTAMSEQKLEELRERGVDKVEVLFIDNLMVGSFLRDTLLVDKIESTEEAVVEIIKKKQSTNPEDLVMIIKPSEDATYKNTVDILDEMTISEIKRYAMVDISDGEYQLVKATEAANGIK